MKSLPLVKTVGVVAALSLAAGCSHMNKEEGTAAGAGGGAIAGAVVGGPVGAVVGAGVGGVAGHEAAGSNNPSPRSSSTASMSRTTSDAAFVRSVQQALDDRGFNAGPPDGRWGPGTQQALREFQRSQGLQATGELDSRTIAALGV